MPNFGSMWEDARPQVDAIVLEHLQRSGAEGWQADEPSDAESLHRARRIKTSVITTRERTWGGWGSEANEAWLCESATIRLKRPVPA